MTTISITPNTSTGSHQLSIVPTGTVTRIQRTDGNGSYDVRTLPGVLPWTVASGTLILDDYEAATGSATYTVTTSADTATAAASLTLDAIWLGVPVTPQFSAKVDAVLDYSTGLDSRAVVLEPDGSPFAVVVTRSASSRRGSMELFAGDYPAALALLRLVGRGQVVLLRQSTHAGMDMFFVGQSADLKTLVTDRGSSRFSVQVQYIEVPRPTAPLSGALGWTWGELKNTYATWGDVFAAYATWGDVRTNRTR